MLHTNEYFKLTAYHKTLFGYWYFGYKDGSLERDNRYGHENSNRITSIFIRAYLTGYQSGKLSKHLKGELNG